MSKTPDRADPGVSKLTAGRYSCNARSVLYVYVQHTHTLTTGDMRSALNTQAKPDTVAKEQLESSIVKSLCPQTVFNMEAKPNPVQQSYTGN